MRKKSYTAIGISTLLTSCAVYEPVSYAQVPVYQAAPQVVYTRPAPVYAPPVTFGFNFGYWSGGSKHFHGHR